MKTFSDFNVWIIGPLAYIAIGGFFLFIAFATVATKRPLLFSMRWVFGLTCLAFLPLWNVEIFATGKIFTIPHTVIVLATLGLLRIGWRETRSYAVFAISETYFREALLAAIAALGYTPEETLSRVKIKETGEEIQASIQSWVGTAQFKPSSQASFAVASRLAVAMKQHFKTSPGEMNYSTTFFYFVFGAIFAALVVAALVHI